MTPYRISGRHRPDTAAASGADDDERFLGWLALVLGAIRVAIALVSGEAWGGEASVAALLIVAGVVALARRARVGERR